MFEQTLNLLPPEYKKVHIPFDSGKVIKIVVASFSLIALIGAGLGISEYSLRQELAVTQEAHQASKMALDQFKAMNTKKALDETIAVRIEKYEEMLRQRQTFLKRLNDENFGNTRGFSEYLLAMARQKFPNIWIEELVIQGEASAFGIKGKAVSPTDITFFLTSLQKEPALDGITFDDLTLSRQPDPKGDFVSFNISYGAFSGFASTTSSALNFALADAYLPIKTQNVKR